MCKLRWLWFTTQIDTCVTSAWKINITSRPIYWQWNDIPTFQIPTKDFPHSNGYNVYIYVCIGDVIQLILLFASFLFVNVTSHISFVLTSILSTDLRRLMIATLIKEKVRFVHWISSNSNPSIQFFFVESIFSLCFIILGQRQNNFSSSLLSNYLLQKSLCLSQKSLNHISMTKWAKIRATTACFTSLCC